MPQLRPGSPCLHPEVNMIGLESCGYSSSQNSLSYSTCLFCFGLHWFFWDKVLLCRARWLQTRDISPSASWVLELQVYTMYGLTCLNSYWWSGNIHLSLSLPLILWGRFLLCSPGCSGTLYAAQDSLKLAIPLTQHLECWDYRCMLLCPATKGNSNRKG